ncbi:DUF1080 domain-containing protein [Flavihumibacter stibioxidans]|uniref:3-keto-alpha-glucoside-1,2-lyase/3-keto-2-hydroxy-glucal hydratase domain-containing protein n=1 Tax=Flavihumibacter stibioxidans TaxID=1834163 RepID=A0ABR7MDR5_9BACT|nr:DUF1080 domain-containing protein [Flavihumibacter stibioxidans]MBC6492910.1 hypothetical protein [Flavihumibacter stibioxidans]
MKKIIPIVLLIVFAGCKSQKNTASPQWVQLFNGKDLKDWTIKIKDHALNENFGNTFRVEDGVMKVRYDQYDGFKEQYGHIFHKNKYSYYLLAVEYRFTGEQAKDGPGWALRNSGAMLHCQSPESMRLEQDFPISLEAQFLGGNGKDERSTGNLCTPGTNVYLNDKLFTPHCVNSRSKTYHGDQWVRAELLVLGDSLIRHIIEGDTVMTYTKPQYDGNDKWVKQSGLPGGGLIGEGYISLQAESHPVEFRKVELIDLSPYKAHAERLGEILQELKTKSH